MRLPSQRMLNSDVGREIGREVVHFEVIEVESGDVLRLAFERVDSTWRQGVWIATEGQLEVDGATSPQFVIWFDTAPPAVVIRVVATDGLLRLHNVWDSGRGLGDHESQSATSGMLVEEDPAGLRRYRCNDIGRSPTFEKCVFTLERTTPAT